MLLRRKVCLIFLGLLSLPAMTMARELYLKPSVQVRPSIDDNSQLIEKKETASGYQATFLGVGGVRSAVSNIALTASADVYRYWGQQGLDRENYNVGVNADHNLSDRHKVGLGADYTSDTSLNSETSSTGLLIGKIARQRFNIAPSWSYLLSETKIVKTGYGHEEVDYAKTINSALISYKTDSVLLNYSDTWGKATRYNVGVNAMRYDAADIQTKTDNVSLTGGAEHAYSETLSFNGMAGVRKTNTTTTQGTRNSYGPLLGAGVTKKFERADVGIDYTKSISPSGIGGFLDIDTVNVNVNYRVTEHLKVMLLGSRISSTTTNNTGGSATFDRQYYSIEPKVAWVFNKQLDLVGGYRYRTQYYTSTSTSTSKNNSGDNVISTTSSDSSAASNSVFVYLDYHLDELTTNRF